MLGTAKAMMIVATVGTLSGITVINKIVTDNSKVRIADKPQALVAEVNKLESALERENRACSKLQPNERVEVAGRMYRKLL